MGSETTLVYYTANLISDKFAKSVRDHLYKIANGRPIVSVSHVSIDFGENICVGRIRPCAYNIYKQILTGAYNCNTKYMACCEDDSLYNMDHFYHTPLDDEFIYNTNRWNVDVSGVYYFRERAGMCMCIAPVDLVIKTLETRFEKYPVELTREQSKGFGEPGRYEEFLGLPPVKMRVFKTSVPTLTFNHRPSLGGKRQILPKDTVQESIPYWGSAKHIWEEYYG